MSKEGTERKKHCFQASVWAQCVPHTIELRRVYRQQDPVFVRLLRMVRVGMCTPEVIDMLRATRKNDIEKDGMLMLERAGVKMYLYL